MQRSLEIDCGGLWVIRIFALAGLLTPDIVMGVIIIHDHVVISIHQLVNYAAISQCLLFLHHPCCLLGLQISLQDGATQPCLV